ncbi:MAG: hypothetical protein HY823_13165 [Acidobacteria bacterium]|nr:hypothetical protein [Acidobacteriota bacterium]
MRQSRKAKRYDDSVLPGEFGGFQEFQERSNADGTLLQGQMRRNGENVEVAQLSLERHSPRKQSFAKLRSKAEGLAEQVTYLRERLEVVDHDRRGMYIQLRSLPPYKDDTQIQYNEISIGRNKVVVKRIAFFRKEEVKQQVPLRLSEGQLSRLLADLGDLV